VCSQIERITKSSTAELPAVGVLTVANRDLWASDYVHSRFLSPSKRGAARHDSLGRICALPRSSKPRRASGQGGTRITRCMGAAACAARVRKAPALAELAAVGGTYESATTRRFFKRRKEVIRVVTSESEAFIEAMLAEDGTDEAVVERGRHCLSELPKCTWLMRRRPGAKRTSTVICSVSELLLGTLSPFLG